MKKETKMTLDNMIAEMLFQTEELNGLQMQIIDVLCQINESEMIEGKISYDTDHGAVDELNDFIVENADEIWKIFNACKMTGHIENIDKLVLLNSKEIDAVKEDTCIIVNFKYINGIPKFCYVRVVYNTERGKGTEKTIFNWNEYETFCMHNLKEIKNCKKKSGFFIKLMLN